MRELMGLSGAFWPPGKLQVLPGVPAHTLRASASNERRHRARHQGRTRCSWPKASPPSTARRFGPRSPGHFERAGLLPKQLRDPLGPVLLGHARGVLDAQAHPPAGAPAPPHTGPAPRAQASRCTIAWHHDSKWSRCTGSHSRVTRWTGRYWGGSGPSRRCAKCSNNESMAHWSRSSSSEPMHLPRLPIKAA